MIIKLPECMLWNAVVDKNQNFILYTVYYKSYIGEKFRGSLDFIRENFCSFAFDKHENKFLSI